MSLDFHLVKVQPVHVFSRNITHNLNNMADAAGIYKFLWRPEETHAKTAGDLIAPLTAGLNKLKADPELYRSMNPDNGWGNYEGLVKFVESVIAACIEDPDATIEVCR